MLSLDRKIDSTGRYNWTDDKANMGRCRRNAKVLLFFTGTLSLSWKCSVLSCFHSTIKFPDNPLVKTLDSFTINLSVIPLEDDIEPNQVKYRIFLTKGIIYYLKFAIYLPR
jgi:hypothetical protein